MKKYENKKDLLQDYIKLARKLNKLPNKREIIKFLCSYERVMKLCSSLNALKADALKTCPELDLIALPAPLVPQDIEDYKIKLEGAKRNKQNKNVIKKVTSLEYVENFAEKVFAGKIEPYKHPKSKAKINRALNLTLSDLHFGSDVGKEETGFLTYGKKEEARRISAVIKQTIDYKPQYRKNTELHVNLLGDIIQNKLHDKEDAAPIAEQVCRAIHLLSQAFAHLAENFPKVFIHCVTGNHGRNTERHHSRANSGKWDSLETIIYYSVKSSLDSYKNLIFNIPKTPFVMYESLGHKVFATHGDNVLNVGNPGKSLNIGRLESQINRINASLVDEDEIKVVVVGHTHCSSVSKLPCGTNVITNGCLLPVDAYAVSLGFLENTASQTLFEMTEQYAMGDIRFIKVGKEHDEDSSLDSIVNAWEDFST